MIKKKLLKYLDDIDLFICDYFNSKRVTNKNFKKIYSSILKSQNIIQIFILSLIIFVFLTFFTDNKI